jgi:hypothetical protein
MALTYGKGDSVMAPSYPGLIPSNVNKDAKYSVVSRPAGGMEIRLIYRVTARERELLTTDRHDALVAMVNQVKIEETAQPGGAFYINEYFDVLVPTQAGGCSYAGTYEKLLEFDFEGGIISPQPPEGLQPGEPWPGPHVGIRYTLTAGGNDIKYWQQVRPGRIQEHRLSDHVGQPAAAQLANRLRQVKGLEGGRVYINEVGEFFAPIDDGDGTVSYVYLGPLEDDPWFPAPDVPRA